VILPVEAWMDLRRYQPLRAAGATWREIADEVGLDWRTVKKYLSTDVPAGPPTAPSRLGTVTRKVDAVAPLIDAWLAADPRLKASVIHERLVAEHGFTGSYQRVKMHLAEARPRVAAELAEGDDNPLRGLHRRFEVIAGAQAQVDWGDEGAILAHVGISKVYSFHFTLSYSRDPFCCYTTSCDMATFWDCHRRAFAHFGGYAGVGPTSAGVRARPWRCSSSGSADGVDAVSGAWHRPGGAGPGQSRRPAGGRLSGVRRGALSPEHGVGDGL
jgi:transposase